MLAICANPQFLQDLETQLQHAGATVVTAADPTTLLDGDVCVWAVELDKKTTLEEIRTAVRIHESAHGGHAHTKFIMYAHEIVADGLAALERWRSHNYAMLITDLHMPRMDGFELATVIRTEEESCSGKHTPIIALTANVVKGVDTLCLKAGMDDCLSKPVLLSELKSRIERWMTTQSGPTAAGVSTPTL